MSTTKEECLCTTPNWRACDCEFARQSRSHEDPNLAGRSPDYVQGYMEAAKKLKAENARLREALSDLPMKIREGMSGYKGEAHRVALQLVEEILSPSTHD